LRKGESLHTQVRPREAACRRQGSPENSTNSQRILPVEADKEPEVAFTLTTVLFLSITLNLEERGRKEKNH
jgi:hypothetical protein